MYQLKPFTATKKPKEPYILFDTIICKIGDYEIGYITRNLARLKHDTFQFALHWTLKIDHRDKIIGNSVEELQDYALNKFREFICNILEP